MTMGSVDGTRPMNPAAVPTRQYIEKDRSQFHDLQMVDLDNDGNLNWLPASDTGTTGMIRAPMTPWACITTK